jgi:peptide/nickel transport system ATP-binding protein
VCDEIVVLYAGRKVESGSRQSCWRHRIRIPICWCRRYWSYGGWLEEIGAPRAPPAIGEVFANGNAPALCSFLQRCPVRIDGVCNLQPPKNVVMHDGKEILCHHSDAELRQLHVRQPVVAE